MKDSVGGSLHPVSGLTTTAGSRRSQTVNINSAQQHDEKPDLKSSV